MSRMYSNHSPLALAIAVAMTGCQGNVHVNANCNGENNCNNYEGSTSGSGGSSESSGSESTDESSTTAALDLPDPETSTETSESTTETDTTDTTESTETETGESDTDDPEPMPVLQGCGNALPFPGDLCYLPQVAINIVSTENAAIGDMNGDGHADVLVLASTSLILYAGDGSGALAVASNTVVPSAATHFALGDVDGDTDLDVALNNGSATRVYFNNGAGLLPTFSEYLSYGGTRETILADLDEDGDLDLATAHDSPKKVAVRKNTAGMFGPQIGYDIDMILNTLRGMVATDLDGDGALDLVVASTAIPAVLYNYGNGTFDGVNEQMLTQFGNITMLALTSEDYDLDGHVDLAVTRSNTNQIRILYGEGQRQFDPMWLDFQGSVNTPVPPLSVDFDVDGIPDIATAQDGSPGQIAIYRGDGAGAFYDGVLFAAKTEAVVIASGDLNEDDVPDIVLVSDSGTPGLSVLLSNP